MRAALAYNYHYTLEYIDNLSYHDVYTLLGSLNAESQIAKSKHKK